MAGDCAAAGVLFGACAQVRDGGNVVAHSANMAILKT